MNSSIQHERLEPDADLVRRTFAQFPSGVACIAAEVGGAIEGIIASSFTVGISLDPPLVLFAVQRSSTTWPVLRTATHLGVSILGKPHDAVCRQIASRPRGERFDGVPVHPGTDGAVYLPDSPVWLECDIHSTFEAGDHEVILLQIHGLGFDTVADPLVFHRSAFPLLTPQEIG